MNSAQEQLLAYYQTLEEPDENGRYTHEFATTVRRLFDALEDCWIYDVLDGPI